MITNILLIILIVLLGGIITLATIWWFKYGKKLFGLISKISNLTPKDNANKFHYDASQLLNEMNKFNKMFRK